MRQMAAIALAALMCACATQYEKNGLWGGFDEVRLAPDLYRISVQANGVTAPERADQIMLLRAAELTIANGFQKFVVEKEDSRTDATTVGYGRSWGTAHMPRGNMVIRMLKASDPRATTAYDAKTIDAELRPRLL